MLKKLRAATAFQVYMLLIVVNMATLACTLYVSIALTNTHRRSLREDSIRLANHEHLVKLTRSAADMNAAGNDVFFSRDPAAERARLARSTAQFQAALARYRAYLGQLRVQPHVTRDLDEIEAGVKRMAAHERNVLALADASSYEKAAREMAVMDREFAGVRASFAQVLDRARAADAHSIVADDAEATRLYRWSITLCAVIATFVIAVAIYAMRLAREFFSAQERARFLEELQKAVAERDAQRDLLARTERIANIGSWDAPVPSGQREQWSDQRYRIVGYEPGEIEPTYANYLAQIPEGEQRDRVSRLVEEAIGNGTESLAYEHPVIRADGEHRVIKIEARIVRDDAGTPSRIFGFAQDVTEQRRAEEGLRLNELRFHTAARATRDMIWDWNVATNFGWVNEVYSTGFGYPTHGDMPMSDWLSAVHPEDAERVGGSVMATLESDENYWSAEYRYRTYSGEWREVFDRGYVVRDADGKPTRVIGAMMDVTKQNRAAAEISRLSSQNNLILKSVGEGLFGVSMDGVAQFVNEAAARMLGWKPEELIGKRLHDVVHYKDRNGVPVSFDACETNLAPRNGEYGTVTNDVFWTRDGTMVPVEHTCNPIIDEAGTVIGIVMTFRDISERQAIDRMKNEFVSTVSHELRTPLTSIRGALGLLATGRLGALPEKAARLLEIAVNNTDRLVRLINEILDIERMESGAVTLSKRECDAAELINEAVEVVRPLAEREHIRIRVDSVPATLEADADRIIQTLTNLLSNAVKFSPPQSSIDVQCVDRETDVLFIVRDEGRGVPAEKLETIFQPFQQVDASDSRDKGGSGLGLAICRSIVRQHGGDIGVESVIGHGSVFSFHIPRSGAAAAVAPAPVDAEPEPAKPQRPRMLIVEDDLDLAGVIAASFERYGVDIMHAATGREAIELAHRVAPDLVVLDLSLPDIDGCSVVEGMKDHCDWRLVPLVVYSAADPSAEEKERLAIGSAHFFTKSRVTPEEFERRVVVLLDAIRRKQAA